MKTTKKEILQLLNYVFYKSNRYIMQNRKRLKGIFYKESEYEIHVRFDNSNYSEVVLSSIEKSYVFNVNKLDIKLNENNIIERDDKWAEFEITMSGKKGNKSFLINSNDSITKIIKKIEDSAKDINCRYLLDLSKYEDF